MYCGWDFHFSEGGTSIHWISVHRDYSERRASESRQRAPKQRVVLPAYTHLTEEFGSACCVHGALEYRRLSVSLELDTEGNILSIALGSV